ncbi:hypothetical protein T439DRAFT_329860 [Meredithblackwellia eburnea MCA 4105]
MGAKVSERFALLASLAFIALLWSITPLSYIYVLWTLACLRWKSMTFGFNQQSQGPAVTLRHAIHFLVLVYASFEIPFSIFYRYLAIKANARWNAATSNGSAGGATRSDLAAIRGIFRQCLESGLEPGFGSHEDPLQALVRGSAVADGDTLDDSPTLRKVTDEKGHLLGIKLDVNDPRVHDFREHLRSWFYKAPFSDIHRGNVITWLSWSLYNQPYEEILEERNQWLKAGRPEREACDQVDGQGVAIELQGEEDKLDLVLHSLKLLEARVAKEFPEGTNPKVKPIRLTLDPVKVASRPLLLYLIVYGMQRLALSKARGFREYTDGDTRYLLRIPKGWTPSQDCEATRPLLVLHGLGMGIAQYSTLIQHLARAPETEHRPLMVLVQPYVSMSFFDRLYLRPPSQKDCTDGLYQVFQRWGFDQSGLTVLSHSNGSIAHGWLLKTYPDLIVRSVFVDPVCFCLWEGSVCINFLYKHARTPLDFLMRYFISRELGVAFVLQRSFQWSSNLLFPMQIPNLKSKYHTAFFLAGEDAILDAGRVHRYLLRHGVEQVATQGCGGVFLHPNQKHGGSLVQRGVMTWIGREEDD